MVVFDLYVFFLLFCFFVYALFLLFFLFNVDKPFPATAQDRESMSCLRLRREESSNNSNQ